MAGCEAAERVLHKANDAVNRALLDEALDDLVSRVDDWKSHKVEQFGKLLMHGVYGVITGKNDQEKDVRNPFQDPSVPANQFSSTRFTCSNASSSAARKFPQTRAKTRRTRRGHKGPKSGTGMLDFNSRAEFS